MSMRDRYWGGTYDDPWIAIYDDPFARVSVIVPATHATRDAEMAMMQRRFESVLSTSCELSTPISKQHGPQRKGRGGKIKRW